MGAEVIRVEDPVTHGYWDVLRGVSPFVDERRGPDFGGPFNNHNVEKLGVTLNLRTDEGKELLRELVAISDVVTENFAPGVMDRLGFPTTSCAPSKRTSCTSPTRATATPAPTATSRPGVRSCRPCCGLAFATGIADQHPAAIGYSYMDHHGANVMAIAIMAGLLHRNRTGDGQWIDISCTDAGAFLNGPALLDYTVNRRPLRRSGSPDSNGSRSPVMAPHGIYPCEGEDNWVAVACRDDRDWRALAGVVAACLVRRGALGRPARAVSRRRRSSIAGWPCGRRSLERFSLAATLREAGVPAAAVQRPSERIDHDPETSDWGLWPRVTHSKMGKIRVDGIPAHFSKTDWVIERGAPCLGEHNDVVFGDLLGHTDEELVAWRAQGVAVSLPGRPDGSSGALEGVRVVELASEHGALAGKILADLGAEVIVVEPPGGHASRRFGPFLDDVPGPERSLWWWYYNTGKLSVVLDLQEASGCRPVPEPRGDERHRARGRTTRPAGRAGSGLPIVRTGAPRAGLGVHHAVWPFEASLGRNR